MWNVFHYMHNNDAKCFVQVSLPICMYIRSLFPPDFIQNGEYRFEMHSQPVSMHEWSSCQVNANGRKLGGCAKGFRLFILINQADINSRVA